MIDFSSARNEKIIRAVRRKLYNIICEDVKHYDDENTMKHIEMFMEGVSWATGIRYRLTDVGKVYVYLRCLLWPEMKVVEVEYRVINVHFELRTLRKSINRHYHKTGGMV